MLKYKNSRTSSNFIWKQIIFISIIITQTINQTTNQ